MTSSICDTCGSGLPDFDAQSCAACGAPVDQPTPAPGADGPLRLKMTDDQWRYVTWGAVAAGSIAVVALIAVVFGLLSRSDAAEATPDAAGLAASTSSTTLPSESSSDVLGAPVTEPVLIEHPRLWSGNRYNRNGAVVGLRLTMDECKRQEGMLHASGTIRNDSLVGQALDYELGVDLTRAVVGTPLGSVEAAVVELGPGETAEWTAETVSTKAVSLRCEVVAVTVSPPSSD